VTAQASSKVDEGHGYKNLHTVSNITDAAIDGSLRASDLDMKIAYLRERNGTRVVTFATATPIANSITEAWVMQHYLRPDLLQAAGVDEFDSWAATFAQTITQIELAPEGGFRQKTRFAKFVNVPEQMRMWHVSADIKTGSDLDLPAPALAPRPGDGQRTPEIVLVQPSEVLLDYVAELGERAERVRSRAVPPEQDNMLVVSSDGRKAALDLRLVGLPMTQPGKIDIAAARITAIWAAHRDHTYPGPDGRDSPVRGSLQIVFSDLGTPADRWNVYDEFRDQLAAGGLSRASVRFIHEARTDREKGELFAACRNGSVAVLVGSTEKMGVGTNVQARAIALHHLDCPWRPADVAQREGRILRQGNHNPEVQILRYVTEKSFDGYLFQAVERKARFIAQVMRGRLDLREIEDIGDAALSYNEVKALATGNPLLLDKAEADAELTRLLRAERAHHRNHDALRYKVNAAERRAEVLAGLIATCDAAIARRQDTRGENFAVVIEGARHDKRHDAGQRWLPLLQQQLDSLDVISRRPVTVIRGQLGGFTVSSTAQLIISVPAMVLALDGIPDGEVHLSSADLAAIDPAKLIQRLENRLRALESARTSAARDIEQVNAETARARDDLAKPFPQTGALAAARDRVARIGQQLQEAAREQSQTGPDTRQAPASNNEANGQARQAVLPARRDFPQNPPPAIPSPTASPQQARNAIAPRTFNTPKQSK
jgi:hypothetical protein